MENQTEVKKDTSKDKIILFVIGVLVGAVISAGAFLISVNTLGGNRGQISGGTPPEMPSGQNSQGSGQPPEKPSEDNSKSDNKEVNSEK